MTILTPLDNASSYMTQPSYIPKDVACPTGLSADGSLIVGYTYSIVARPGLFPNEEWEAATWNAQGAVTALPEVPGTTSMQSLAEGVSHDGNVIVGRQETYWALRWTPGVQVLTDYTQGPNRPCVAMAVSGDGQFVAGGGSTYGAWRWSQTGGFQDLGQLAGGVDYYESDAISYDGSAVAGRAYTDRGYEAWRWTAQQGMLGLGGLAGDTTWKYSVTGMSEDGQTVVGYNGGTTRDSTAFRWTLSGGMEALENLPGEDGDTWAYCISGDGTLIGGSTTRLEATLWNRGTPLEVESLLTDLGYDMTGWRLFRVLAITPDGQTIAGQGRSPDGVAVGWVATIPEPFASALLAGGLSILLACRKRR